MKLNASYLFDELNITYDTGSKHSTKGWYQLTCPFCYDTKDHLGYNINKEYFHCWKCGWHPLIETIAELSNLSKWEVSQAVDRHRTGKRSKKEAETATVPKHIELPKGTRTLEKTHADYLVKRGFPISAIKEIQKTYNILGTGPTGIYKLRIIFPITYYGKLVSYQGRDITNKSKMRYLACDGKEEIRPHKHCLFGADLAKGDSVVIVEGILDAIKLGPGAVATFGTEFSWSQVKQLADRWKNRYILFDKDEAGILGAKKLCNALSDINNNTYNINLSKLKDPGELSFHDAREFMKTTIKNDLDEVESPLMPPRKQFKVNIAVKSIEKGSPINK